MKDNVIVATAAMLSIGILMSLWCHSNTICKRLDRIASALERAYPVQAEAR